jgi:hypothetical protein
MPKLRVGLKRTAPLAEVKVDSTVLVVSETVDDEDFYQATLKRRKKPYLLTWLIRGAPNDTYRLRVIEPEDDKFDTTEVPLEDDMVGVGVHPIHKGTQP